MKYPYIGELKSGSGGVVIFASKESAAKLNSEGKNWERSDTYLYSDEWDEDLFKNITREYLSNTWGVVESKEHAEFIIELCKANNISVYKYSYPIKKDMFSVNKNGILFFHEGSWLSLGNEFKQITIPLPPKAKTEKPDFSKLPIHFDCVCNKCGGKCCIGNCDEWSKVGGDKVMNNIKWKDGAVCFAGGEQYSDVFVPVAVMAKDFQLNEIRIGDYIEASELDTEQKYNDAVEVFGLFGFKVCDKVNDFNWFASGSAFKIESLVLTERNIMGSKYVGSVFQHKRKLTYQQLMTIGKLKKAMIDFEKFNRSDIPQNEKRNKSKQAYEVLKSLDYDYDLDKQKWFKKEYI